VTEKGRSAYKFYGVGYGVKDFLRVKIFKSGKIGLNGSALSKNMYVTIFPCRV